MLLLTTVQGYKRRRELAVQTLLSRSLTKILILLTTVKNCSDAPPSHGHPLILEADPRSISPHRIIDSKSVCALELRTYYYVQNVRDSHK